MPHDGERYKAAEVLNKVGVVVFWGRGKRRFALQALFNGIANDAGKDPSKVDRSGAYMGRYIAKNIVAAGLAKVCEVQIAYSIGVADPVSILVTSQNTSEYPDSVLTDAVREVFNLRPYYITKRLDLKRPIYSKTSCYGHFGRELPEFTWEKRDAVNDLVTAVQKH